MHLHELESRKFLENIFASLFLIFSVTFQSGYLQIEGCLLRLLVCAC